MISNVTCTPEEVVQRGREIYERTLRPQIENEQNFGKFLEIDIESGEYELDENHLTAARRLKARCPNAVLYGMRVGYPAIYSFHSAGSIPQP